MAYARSFHNTTESQGKDLFDYEQKALSQEEKILLFFRAWDEQVPGAVCTPSRINELVLPEAPLTSVHRAMTNLTKAGMLVKTDTQKEGMYGRPEYLWKLRGG
jgi:hypothetical protein